MPDAIQLYISLLKKCVSNSIYDDDLDLMRGKAALDPQTGKYRVVEATPADPAIKAGGGIWPSRAHTMIGAARLDNLHWCVEQVLREHVPGDLIEAGVWRGGAAILMRGILKAHGVADRIVWAADSFEGLPPPDPDRYPRESPMEFHKYGDLAVPMKQVRDNFARYGLLDEQVRFLKGWFRDTLPAAPIRELAVMRLDGDMYESTIDGLTNLYPKLSPGGFAIIDDYNAVEACNAAVDEYRASNGINEELVSIARAGAWWRKKR
jgi:hypothetical protein